MESVDAQRRFPSDQPGCHHIIGNTADMVWMKVSEDHVGELVNGNARFVQTHQWASIAINENSPMTPLEHHVGVLMIFIGHGICRAQDNELRHELLPLSGG